MSSIASLLVVVMGLVGAFFWGRSTAVQPHVEVITKIDTLFVDSPIPIEVESTNEYRDLYFALSDSMSTLRDSVASIEPIIRIDTITRELYISMPQKRWSFTDSVSYAMDILSPLEPVVERMEIYNTSTTTILSKRPKRWSITLGANTFTSQGLTEVAFSAGVEYRRSKFSLTSDYKIRADGGSGVAFGVRYIPFCF